MGDDRDTVAVRAKQWFHTLVRGCRRPHSTTTPGFYRRRRQKNCPATKSPTSVTHVYSSTHDIVDNNNRLVALVDDLRSGVTTAFENKKDAAHLKDCVHVERVSSKLSFLDTQIRRVNGLRQTSNLNPSELVTHCKELTALIECIREDVFNAYLQLTPQQKIGLLDRDKQMACIFAVLGILESEVAGFVKSTQPEEDRVLSGIKPILKPTATRVRMKKVARRVADVLNCPSKVTRIPAYYFTMGNESTSSDMSEDEDVLAVTRSTPSLKLETKDFLVPEHEQSWKKVAETLTINPIAH